MQCKSAVDLHTCLHINTSAWLDTHETDVKVYCGMTTYLSLGSDALQLLLAAAEGFAGLITYLKQNLCMTLMQLGSCLLCVNRLLLQLVFFLQYRKLQGTA